MRQAIVVGMVVTSLAGGGCAKRSKVELEYEPPVTNVWTGEQGRGAPAPPRPAPQAAPPQMGNAAAGYPPLAPAPGQYVLQK